MNHEGEASSSAQAARRQDGDERGQFGAAPTAAELTERRKKNRQMFNKKRGQLLDHLVKDLDMLVYAELSAVYYMDCSFLRFAMRVLTQFMYLTPKHPTLPEHPSEWPMLLGLLASNAFCILLHFILKPASAGEATRGHLHGGLVMDFIGQAGPSSKIHLLLLDLMVLGLQLTQMAACMLKGRLKEATTIITASTEVVRPTQPSTTIGQDLDAEERGVNRADEQQDIEMQTLTAAGAATADSNDPSNAPQAEDESSERDTLLNPVAPHDDTHILEAFYSGQIVIADLDLRRRIVDQVQLIKNYRADPEAASSSVQMLRSELANRILRMRMGADALRQTI